MDESTTLCACVKITRSDCVRVGFTSLDEDITINCVTYRSISGYTPKNVQARADMTPSNSDIDGLIDAGLISKEDVVNGLYNNANVKIFMYDYIAQQEVGKSYLGWFGEFKSVNGKFVADFRSISRILNQKYGRVIQSTCDAVLGDARCTVDLAPWSQQTTITTVTSSSEVIVATQLTELTDAQYRYILITSGNSAGALMDIASIDYVTNTVYLVNPLTIKPAAGDSVVCVRDCDKTFTTCKNTFDNAINFRGFNAVPQPESSYESATAGSC